MIDYMTKDNAIDIEGATFTEQFEALRPDQQRAMACLGQLIDEIMASEKQVIFGALYVGRPDLLQDRQVIWYGNVTDEEWLDLLKHAIGRMERKISLKNKR